MMRLFVLALLLAGTAVLAQVRVGGGGAINIAGGAGGGGGGGSVSEPTSYSGTRAPWLFGGSYNGTMNGNALRYSVTEATWVTASWNNTSTNPGLWATYISPNSTQASGYYIQPSRADGNSQAYTASFLVPAGWYYDIVTNGESGNTTVFTWLEFQFLFGS